MVKFLSQNKEKLFNLKSIIEFIS